MASVINSRCEEARQYQSALLLQIQQSFSVLWKKMDTLGKRIEYFHVCSPHTEGG